MRPMGVVLALGLVAALLWGCEPSTRDETVQAVGPHDAVVIPDGPTMPPPFYVGEAPPPPPARVLVPGMGTTAPAAIAPSPPPAPAKAKGKGKGKGKNPATTAT